MIMAIPEADLLRIGKWPGPCTSEVPRPDPGRVRDRRPTRHDLRVTASMGRPWRRVDSVPHREAPLHPEDGPMADLLA